MSAALLIDTHFLIWMRADPARLTAGERSAIEQARSRYVSAISFWEIAVLMDVGRLAEDRRFFDVPEGYDLLPVLPRHCSAIRELPRIHRDPYDRMLMAQARTDALSLISRDGEIRKYADAGFVSLVK